MPRKGTRYVTVYLTEVEDRWIAHFAKLDDLSESAVVRDMVRAAIRRRASAGLSTTPATR